MAIFSAVSRALTILAIVGLVTGVFAGPGAAGPMSGMTDMAATTDGGMPPCDQTTPVDCGDMQTCPFAVVCLAKCPQNVPKAAPVLHCASLLKAALPRNDAQESSIALSPLGHPPKA